MTGRVGRARELGRDRLAPGGGLGFVNHDDGVSRRVAHRAREATGRVRARHAEREGDLPPRLVGEPAVRADATSTHTLGTANDVIGDRGELAGRPVDRDHPSVIALHQGVEGEQRALPGGA